MHSTIDTSTTKEASAIVEPGGPKVPGGPLTVKVTRGFRLIVLPEYVHNFAAANAHVLLQLLHVSDIEYIHNNNSY